MSEVTLYGHHLGFKTPPLVLRLRVLGLQGYLAHEEQPPRRTLQ